MRSQREEERRKEENEEIENRKWKQIIIKQGKNE